MAHGARARWTAAFVWPFVALAVFASLQVWRIGIFDQIQRGLHSSQALTVSAQRMSRLSEWAGQAAWARSMAGENTFQAMGDVRRTLDERPLQVVWFVGACAAIGPLGYAAAVGVSTGGLMLRRRGLWGLGARQKWRAACHAVNLTWGWWVPMGVLVGAGVWFIGFDRAGSARPLTAGLTPTAVQAVAVAVGWGVAVGAASAVFWGRGAAAAVRGADGGLLCARCRYPRESVRGGRCPECGAVYVEEAGEPRSVRAGHRRIGVAGVGVLALVGLATAGAYAAGGASRAWLRLEPWARGWIQVAQLERDGTPVDLRSRYGPVRLWAEYRPPAGAGGVGEWTVHWRFESSEPALARSGSGLFNASDRVTTLERREFAEHALPFGDLRTQRYSEDPRLWVGATSASFPEKYGWSSQSETEGP